MCDRSSAFHVAPRVTAVTVRRPGKKIEETGRHTIPRPELVWLRGTPHPRQGRFGTRRAFPRASRRSVASVTRAITARGASHAPRPSLPPAPFPNARASFVAHARRDASDDPQPFYNNRGRVTEAGLFVTVRRSDLASSLPTIYITQVSPPRPHSHTSTANVGALRGCPRTPYIAQCVPEPRPTTHPPLHATPIRRYPNGRISSPAVSSFRSADRRRRFAGESRGRAKSWRNRRHRALGAPWRTPPSPRALSRPASRTVHLSTGRNRTKRPSASPIRVPRL